MQQRRCGHAFQAPQGHAQVQLVKLQHLTTAKTRPASMAARAMCALNVASQLRGCSFSAEGHEDEALEDAAAWAVTPRCTWADGSRDAWNAMRCWCGVARRRAGRAAAGMHTGRACPLRSAACAGRIEICIFDRSGELCVARGTEKARQKGAGPNPPHL